MRLSCCACGAEIKISRDEVIIVGWRVCEDCKKKLYQKAEGVKKDVRNNDGVGSSV